MTVRTPDVGEQINIKQQGRKPTGLYTVSSVDSKYIYVTRNSAEQKKIQYVLRCAEGITWSKLA